MIFLDTSLLWVIVHPKGGPLALQLRQMLQRQLQKGARIAVAEICDYEARRELLRKRATRQIANLDKFISVNTYVPLDTDTMREAAALWAKLRTSGRPTAPNDALDGDVILGAQALRQGTHTVATTNLRHLQLVCTAVDWRAL